MATKLRAIEGQGVTEDFGILPRDGDGDPLPLDSSLGRPILRRPGDHIETLWLKDGSVLSELRTAACDRRLHPDTAAAIVLERRLAIESLADLGDPSLVDWLNHLGAGQRPEVELWSAHSAYLGHLLHGARSAPSSTHKTSARISLPIRLIDRLAAGIPPAIEPADVELHHAVAWEIAALLSGETLAEWGYRSALMRSSQAVRQH
jgi:hypothetical protein